jgi:hypothetical protein
MVSEQDLERIRKKEGVAKFEALLVPHRVVTEENPNDCMFRLGFEPRGVPPEPSCFMSCEIKVKALRNTSELP